MPVLDRANLESADNLRVNLAELIARKPGAMITEADVRTAAGRPAT